MKVIDVLERVTTLYNDREYVRVPESHYLKFLDDSLSQLVLSRPDAHVKHSIVQLKQGTRQDLPDEGYTLIDIYMNKKPIAGTDPVEFENYRPVFQVERKDLDYFDNWQSGINTVNYDYINEFAYDDRSPKTYWVTPFVGNTPVFIEMDYSYGVEKYGDMKDTPEVIRQKDIPVSETFLGPVVSYMLFMLYSTDSTSAIDREVASKYEASFYQGLGLEYNAVQIVMPKIEDIQIAKAGA